MDNASIDQKVKDFKQNLMNSNLHGLVLDIDETLSWTIGHWIERMQIEFGNPENLSIPEMIKKYRYTQNVPYWKTDEALQWMENAKNDNELHEVLPLIHESNTIANKINEIMPIVGYLTIRPRNVVSGTKKWLDKHGFPQVGILALPLDIPSEQGNKWKAEVLEFLYPEVLGIVDDNPSVVKSLSENYKGTIFLYDNETTDNKNLDIIPCKRWADVYGKVRDEVNKLK